MMVNLIVGLAVILASSVANRLIYKNDRRGILIDAISMGISITLFLAYILIVHNYEI
jgi:hypothetical protein